MIFLDTNIISYYFNANIKNKEKILEVIDDGEDICITIINIYEIDYDVINIASNLYANLRKTGNVIGDADILIAAIVMRHNGILISNNIKHYEVIEGLRLANWL
jgi:tRNA(fMet)-specific endonuclease VapC